MKNEIKLKNMQTTIIKKVDQQTINKIFDDGKINIRSFTPAQKGFYQIDIRHGEKENPETLLNNEIKKLTTNS